MGASRVTETEILKADDEEKFSHTLSTTMYIKVKYP